MKYKAITMLAAFLLSTAPASAADINPALKTLLGLPGGTEPSSELKTCFERHRAHLETKPNDLSQLVTDFEGNDAMMRDCAIAAEANFIMKSYVISSPVNSYGPLIRALSAQTKVVKGKPAKIACPTRQLMMEAALQFDKIQADFLPNYTYEWIGKVADPAC